MGLGTRLNQRPEPLHLGGMGDTRGKSKASSWWKYSWWTLMCQLVLVLPHLTHNWEFKGTETCGHVMIGKGIPWRPALFLAYFQTNSNLPLLSHPTLTVQTLRADNRLFPASHASPHNHIFCSTATVLSYLNLYSIYTRPPMWALHLLPRPLHQLNTALRTTVTTYSSLHQNVCWKTWRSYKSAFKGTTTASIIC